MSSAWEEGKYEEKKDSNLQQQGKFILALDPKKTAEALMHGVNSAHKTRSILLSTLH